MTQAPKPTALQRQEAAEWLVRLDDAADEGLALAFADWLEGEPGRQEAFAQVEAAFVDIDIAGPEALTEKNSSTVRTLTPRSEPRPRAWLWTGAAAAAALVAVTVGVTQFRVTTQSYQTGVGESRQVTLTDGSRIVLGGGSSLEVRTKGKARSASLTKGEADFDIVHDPDRPFEVAAGADTVRVLGTHFDIARNAGSLTVSVARGLVSVDRPDDGRAAVLLSAGKQLHRHEGGADQVRDVDQFEAASWRNGRLVYQDRPLAEVAEDLSRYLPVPISVAPDAADLSVTGVLNITDEEAMVARLQTFLHVQATRTEAGIRLERGKD